MKRTITDGIRKIEIIEKESYFEVTFFELMGGRYVRLGDAENWSKELVKEEFGEIYGALKEKELI